MNCKFCKPEKKCDRCQYPVQWVTVTENLTDKVDISKISDWYEEYCKKLEEEKKQKTPQAG